MKTNKKVQLKDVGFKDYKDIWEYQTSLLDSIIAVKRQNRKENTNNPTKNYFLVQRNNNSLYKINLMFKEMMH